MKHFDLIAGPARHSHLPTATRYALVGALLAIGALSCAKQQVATGSGGSGGSATSTTATSTGSSSGSSTSTGMSLCAMDCSKIQTPPCLKSVCNDGSFPGTVGACVVVNADGAPCDDGKFCTTKDTCMGGQCVGGPANTCGMMSLPCNKVSCSESTKSCVSAPDASQDGSSCTSTDLCQTGAVCMAGTCAGTTKDCSFDPAAECNAVACDPSTGMCKATVDTSKNGAMCMLTGDLCKNGKTCSAGMCTGGTAKDCSSLTHDCVVGQCVASNGMCMAMAIPAGGTCAAATDQCNQGICNATGVCNPMPLPTGTACNDHNACTSGDSCNAGVCSGSAVTGCSVYYTESFETCPAGWTLAGDWQCGVPTVVGPPSAESGTKVIGTVINGNYNPNDTWAATIATSPPINLTSATNPQLVFYVWVDTEGSSFDGANLKISTDNGATFTLVTTSKAYPLTIGSQPAWGGHESNATGSNLGWQRVTANLQPYVGHNVLLRFAFQSDGSGQYPGVYVDDMTVAEANAIPLAITTTSIPTAFSGHAYTANLSRSGGSPNAVWSIAAGGTNYAWLTINPMTGTLTGTPTATNVGPALVHVHIQEPSLPSNFADQTFNFTVASPIYYQNFEGACPNGWTLTGTWQCGTPTPLPAGNGTAPASAYSGSKCIATGIGTGYADSLDWAGNTATSPAIMLTGASPKLDFVAYLESEVNYDGFNVQVSTDGGATYSVVSGVNPAYKGMIGTPTESAWEAYPATGWKPYTVDLAPYANQTILLRFAFRSDLSTHYAGAYIDDVVVH